MYEKDRSTLFKAPLLPSFSFFFNHISTHEILFPHSCPGQHLTPTAFARRGSLQGGELLVLFG